MHQDTDKRRTTRAIIARMPGRTSNKMPVRIIPARKGGSPDWIFYYDETRPPDIFFDTNVWIGMSNSDSGALSSIQTKRGFGYRYSVTNYCELLSHLEDPPSESCGDPFIKYRQCFRKMIQICHHEVLPSPEMEFLAMTGLEHYLDSVWIPNPDQTALAIELVTNARSLSELTGAALNQVGLLGLPRYVVKPSHYRKLRDADKDSFIKITGMLSEISPPITGSDRQKMNMLGKWLILLGIFFFLIRPSSEKINFDLLEEDEKERFGLAFTRGAGRLFQSHCTIIAKKTINERRRIEPNDLYDAMQLLHLRDDNRVFVTDDRFFYLYEIDPEIQRVIPWSAFKRSV